MVLYGDDTSDDLGNSIIILKNIKYIHLQLRTSRNSSQDRQSVNLSPNGFQKT